VSNTLPTVFNTQVTGCKREKGTHVSYPNRNLAGDAQVTGYKLEKGKHLYEIQYEIVDETEWQHLPNVDVTMVRPPKPLPSKLGSYTSKLGSYTSKLGSYKTV